MPQGSRMKSYSTVRQPTGSFSAVHSQRKKPPPRPAQRQRARLVDPHPEQRPRPAPAPAGPAAARPAARAASSGRPITVSVSTAPVNSTVTTYAKPISDTGRFARRCAISFQVCRS